MSAIDYKALAERLEAHAECHANVEPFDDEQRQWADDLRTVVSLLGGMADAALIDRLLKTLRYLIGIAERGEGRKIRDDETIEQFVLGYVKRLEAGEAALRAEVERLKAAIDMQPSSPTREDMEWADKVFLAKAEKENDALRAEVEALRAERDQLAEFVIAVGGFWGHSKSKLVGESSLAEVINRSIEDEDALRKDAECFRLLKARMGAAIDAALAQAKDAEARG